jgi:prepilin-type N-terminal cleavage/methylation domain-containing protein
MHTNRKGFTLIEVLVVIAIIAILAGVVFIGYQRIMDRFYAHKAEQEVGNFERLLEGYFLNEDAYVDVTTFAKHDNTSYFTVDVIVKYDHINKKLSFSYIDFPEGAYSQRKIQITEQALSNLYKELLEGKNVEIIGINSDPGDSTLELEIDDTKAFMHFTYISEHDHELAWSIAMEMVE